jgi:hypothetical protein
LVPHGGLSLQLAAQQTLFDPLPLLTQLPWTHSLFPPHAWPSAFKQLPFTQEKPDAQPVLEPEQLPAQIPPKHT